MFNVEGRERWKGRINRRGRGKSDRYFETASSSLNFLMEEDDRKREAKAPITRMKMSLERWKP